MRKPKWFTDCFPSDDIPRLLHIMVKDDEKILAYIRRLFITPDLLGDWSFVLLFGWIQNYESAIFLDMDRKI